MGSIPTSFPGGFTTALFALKLPVAGGNKTVTFAYVDPVHATAVELNSWGAAHGPLWDAIRAKGRRVEVIAIGAELDMVLRADRMLQLWAAAEPGKTPTDPYRPRRSCMKSRTLRARGTAHLRKRFRAECCVYEKTVELNATSCSNTPAGPPSAKATGFQVSLTKCDYDHLPKKEKDVVYLIVDRPALE